MRNIRSTLILVAALAVSGRAFAASYWIDNDHTNIGFSVKHLEVFFVRGKFGDFSGYFDFDEKTLALTRATVGITAETVDTGVAKRDEALRSKDFLNVEKFPEITFNLKSSRTDPDKKIHVVGDITIRKITKEIKLDGEYLGAVTDNVGNERVGFTARGVIRRGDFGITWNQPLDTGGKLVGEEVKITLDIEGIKKR
ncbi:MAG: polyisoprenoid-binding protein [Nitrospinae bacterium]|nr:polyisoprenoid-binding protein [Nitrospinota bacterium]